MLVSASGQAAQNPFSDVPQDHWAYDAVDQLAADGVIEGYGDSTFRGDRSITRYEMSQMVAKAMAKNDLKAEDKALIDKLSAEFSQELSSLGVRVAELERNADNFRFDGFFRIRHEHFGKENKIDDTTKAYIELYGHGRVNEHWSAESKHKLTLDMKKDAGAPGTIQTTNMYALGKYKNFTVKFGEFDTVDGYAYTHEDPMSGVQVEFGKKLKTRLSWGRIENPNNNFSAAGYGAITMRYPLTKKFNLYGGYHYFRAVDPGYKQIGDDNYGIANVGFDTLLGKNFRFVALYARSSAETKLNKNGYFLELDYKRMDLQNPGTYMIMLRNFRVNDATAISSRYEAYTHGNVQGTELGFCYAPIKNVEVGAKYFWGKDVNSHDKKDFLRAEVKYFF